MQYVYNENSGDLTLDIEGDSYKYLFRVRRHTINEVLDFRNLRDNRVYKYKVIDISKKDAKLQLIDSKDDEVVPEKEFILAWMIVDPKTVEKTIPFLNELGVNEIAFIYGDYSQKNFKLNFDKLEKISINSSGQCGRTNIMKFSLYNSLKEFKDNYPESYLFNFSNNLVENNVQNIDAIVVGPEGGFSKNELKLFDNEKIVGITSKNILRSETAVITLCSKVLV